MKKQLDICLNISQKIVIINQNLNKTILNPKDMKKLLIILCLITTNVVVNAQGELKVFLDWMTAEGTQNYFYKNVTKTDQNNNVYIVGATVNGSGNYDILLTRYDRDGVLQWTRQYNGSGNGNDIGTGLFIDNSGNVYITGTTTISVTNTNIITIKYNSSGTQQWLSTYNATGDSYDSGSDLVVDASGNVYITGGSYNSSLNSDIVTVKYNSSGSEQWVRSYDYDGFNDGGVKILLNSDVYISGIAQYSASSYYYGTLIYSTSGTLKEVNASGTSSTGINQINDMVTDATGNIYIAGASPVTGQGYDYTIIKLNSTLGISWERTYNGNDDLDDIARGLKVDTSGNVFVTGFSTTSSEGKNIITIKYDSSGTQQWLETYNDSLNGDDEAYAMAMDNSDNIYITGYISTEIDNFDCFTMKYDSAGNAIWSIHDDGSAHLSDKATSIVIDGNGDILIAGSSETAPGEYQYLTLKYIEKEIITPTDYDNEAPNSSFLYYRNNGQIIDTDGEPVSDIKYYAKSSSPEFYIKKDNFSFVFARVDTILSTADTLQRIDVAFSKSSSNAKTYPLEETNSYINYFLGHCPEGITEIRGNQRLITTNLYPNVDLMYSSNQDGIKYYFIIKPGGDPTDIELEFNGANSFYINETTNDLTINSDIGSLTFERPTVYQLDKYNDIIPISGWTADWSEGSSSNFYHFYIESYDTTKSLIIQVDLGHTQQSQQQTSNLDWSTYFGGTMQDCGKDLITDASGNLYIVGDSHSTNFPVYSGSQTTMNGSTQSAIIGQFNDLGHRNWVTFFGGNSSEDGIATTFDNANKWLYILGRTFSANLPFPNPNNGSFIQTVRKGTNDAFIVRFEPATGYPKWVTYFGGGSHEIPTDITVDNLGNIFITGYTMSNVSYYTNNCGVPTNNDFPLCNPGNNAYFQSYIKDLNPDAFIYWDSFISEFDINGSLVWSTFFGGDGSDKPTSIALDKTNGDLFIAGYTTSTQPPMDNFTSPCQLSSYYQFPYCNAGGSSFYQTYNYGTREVGFISKFNNIHQLTWSTYFGATTIGDIDINSDGDVYISGSKYANNDIVTTCIVTDPFDEKFHICDPGNNSFSQNYNGGNSDAFIARFSNGGQLKWSSLYGGNSNERIYQNGLLGGVGSLITIDNSNNVFLVGSTAKSQTGSSFPVFNHNGAYYQAENADPYSVISEGYDGFLAVFNLNNERLWATNFGGSKVNNGQLNDGNDEIFGITTYSNQKLYLTGYTQSNSFPTFFPTIGNPYHQSSNGVNQDIDAFISRFDLSAIISVEDIEANKSNFLIYPNPSNGIYTLNFKLLELKNCDIKVYDIIGNVVYFEQFSNKIGILEKQLNLTHFTDGIYLIKIQYGTEIFCTKVIKQN